MIFFTKNTVKQYTTIACQPFLKIVDNTPTIPVALLNKRKQRNKSANTGKGKIKQPLTDGLTIDDKKKNKTK